VIEYSLRTLNEETKFMDVPIGGNSYLNEDNAQGCVEEGLRGNGDNALQLLGKSISIHVRL